MNRSSSIGSGGGNAAGYDGASVSSTTGTSARYETFTEAVPLSLSSMAHSNIPLDAGLLDGIKQVLSHTLLSCVNYARILYQPHTWTFHDLCTSEFSWSGYSTKNKSPPSDVPFALEKRNFKHQYCRNAFIYLKPAFVKANIQSIDDEIQYIDNWQTTKEGILGRITLHYISEEALTQEELLGIEVNDEDMPTIILYKVVVEYRSLPASGKESPVLAEELSMLSFGGSIDDDVKYGALAALYDTVAKYVLEIYSVRGKKYKFDLMDSTLSDGTVPRLPATMEGHPFAKCLCVTVTNHNLNNTLMDNIEEGNENANDSGEKVVEESVENTETKLLSEKQQPKGDNHEGENDNDKDEADDKTAPTANHVVNEDNNDNDQSISNKRQKTEHDASQQATTTLNKNQNRYSITRMNLILDGPLREDLKNKDAYPSFDYLSTCIASTFLCLNPKPPSSVSAHPSKHTLILDPDYAGHVYINGQYITTWNEDVRIGSYGVALYGMDIHNVVPIWNGKITDYELLREAYAQLWQELLVDARVVHLQLSRHLLYRLMKGKDPPNTMNKKALTSSITILDSSDINEEYDDDDDDAFEASNVVSNSSSSNEQVNGVTINEDVTRSSIAVSITPVHVNVNVDCLETQVLGSQVQYDRVGIAAKALATRFAVEFGLDAYPCLAHETIWVKKALPTRRPIIVPQRLITILRRGGYFDIQKTCDLLWYEDTRPIQQTTSNVTEDVKEDETKDESNEADKTSVNADNNEQAIIQETIRLLEQSDCTFVDMTNICIVKTPLLYNVMTLDAVCRYNEEDEMFYIHESYFSTPIDDLMKEYKENVVSDTKPPPSSKDDEETTTPPQIDPTIRVKAFLLGMYIAKSYPHGKSLIKYLIRNRP